MSPPDVIVQAPVKVVRLVPEPALLVRVETQPARVLSVAVQGRPGAQGNIGPAGGQAVYTAGQALSGHRLVLLRAGVARYPDLSVPSDAYALIGLTTGAVESGATFAAVAAGLVEEPSWTWTPGALVYAGPAGSLTQTPPPSGWLRVVGVAQTPTSLLVALREPIMQQE